MKKFFAAICCMLLVGGSVVAQEATATPVADAAATQEVSPAVEAPVVESPVVESSVMEGTQVQIGVPMVTNQGCGCGGTVMTSAPAVGAAVATNACCAPRRSGFRSRFTGLRSRFGSRRNNCCN